MPACTFLFFRHVCAVSCIFFFFFQAEDGIRDLTVTGVQTCALPICQRQEEFAQQRIVTQSREDGEAVPCGERERLRVPPQEPQNGFRRAEHGVRRSEERRVGKEGRSRWSPYH